MRRKKGDEHGTAGEGGGRITPVDVQQVEFRLAFRGYNERDVDGFLDRITEDLAVYLEENQQLRSGAGLPATQAPAAPVGSTESAQAEAERILADAREEAGAILRRAEQQAAANHAGAGGSPDARTAVAPFLNTEREFLQSLGSLVQTHAEEIKQMVLALRARSERAAADVPREGAMEPSVEHEATPVEAASVAEIRERLGEPGPPAQARREEPVVIESKTEPAYSSEGAPAGEGRERSLRELFWGED